MTRAASGVALTLTLPVDVLIKSAPASIASIEALRISSGVLSRPVSRMTLKTTLRPRRSPTASIAFFITTISSLAPASSPARNLLSASTISISSAPFSTASSHSRTFTSRKLWAVGKQLETAVTWRASHGLFSRTTFARFGYTQTDAGSGYEGYSFVRTVTFSTRFFTDSGVSSV